MEIHPKHILLWLHFDDRQPLIKTPKPPINNVAKLIKKAPLNSLYQSINIYYLDTKAAKQSSPKPMNGTDMGDGSV